jgi:large subunit ribosomal protein L10
MIKIGRIFRDQIVTTIKTGVTDRKNAFVINYSKVGSGPLCSLRKLLQQKNAKMYTSRSALAKIALKDMQLTTIAETLDGSTAFVWSDADPVDVAKVLVKFEEKNEGFVVRAAIVDKNIIKKEDVKRLSELPAKEVLVAQLLGTLQAPMTRLARALNGKTTELLLLLKQLSEKRGGN